MPAVLLARGQAGEILRDCNAAVVAVHGLHAWHWQVLSACGRAWVAAWHVAPPPAAASHDIAFAWRCARRQIKVTATVVHSGHFFDNSKKCSTVVLGSSRIASKVVCRESSGRLHTRAHLRHCTRTATYLKATTRTLTCRGSGCSTKARALPKLK